MTVRYDWNNIKNDYRAGLVSIRAIATRYNVPSADNLTLEAASLNNRGQLLTNGNLIFKSAGDITNRGLISAQRQLNITGRNLTQNDGRSASGGAATYRLSGTLDNLGRLTGSDDIDLQAREINNRGTLGSQKNLRLVSQGAINNQADTLLFAGGNMTLHGTRLYNRYGDLYSRGDLDFARDDNGGYADSLENRSGTIEAEGDIRLRVNSLLNTRDVFEMVQELSSAYIRRGENYFCKGNCKHVDYTLVEKNSSSIKKDSPAASIVAGGNFDSNGNGALVNRYSLIAANENLHINAGSLENTGASAEESTRERKYQALFGRHHHDERNDTAFNKEEIDPWNAKGGKGSDSQPLPNPLTEGNYKSYVKYGRGHLILLQDKTTRSENGNAASAIIQAGSRVSINVSQRIDNGEISNNKRAQLDSRLGSTEKNAPVVGLDYTLNRRTDSAVAVKEDGSQVKQSRQVPGLIATNEYQDTKNASGAVIGRSASTGLDFIPIDYSGFNFERVPPTQLSSFRLPEGQYGLFVRNKAPDSHYLIETNPEFTSADRLMGSDYMLGRLDYTSDGAYKLLGDGRYESRLIRDAVQAKTGSRFLDENLKNDYDQYLYLMNNAIAASDELHLTAGVSLTPSQTAALTHDIVWMEEQEVDGETVLAPVLYLAQVGERNVRGSSLIQGRDIDLIAGGDLASVGTIRAANNLTANSGSSILQGGLMAAGNNLALTATDDLRNSLAGEIRGQQVDLTTLKGDIVNDRLAAKNGSDRRYDTVIDQGGLISATGALNVSAGRDLINRSDIASAGDITLDAGRDLLLASVEDSRGDDSSNGHTRSSRTRQISSNVQAAGNIAMQANRNIGITASDVSAGRNLQLATSNDIQITSAEDLDHYELHKRSPNTKKDIIDTHTRQQGSQLTAGNNLTLVADNDLTAQASQLRAGDQAYLVGGNDVQLIAANDQDYHFYQKKKKSGGLISSKSMKRDEVTDTRAVGTTVESGGDLVIASGNDQVYQKTRLDAGGDLTLTSGGDITFAAAMDTHSESHEKSRSNWAWQSAKGKGSTDETLRQSELVAQGQLAINAANRVNIDVRDIDQQSVSQTIDAMVAAEPELAWLKQAEAQGDVDWRQVKEIHDRWNYKQSGLGEGAALAVSIAAAAVVGPAVSGLAGGGLMGAMATGAAGSLAGNGAVSLINNRGNLGATLSDTLSSDRLKSALVAAASAGAAQQLDSVWHGEIDQVTGKVKDLELNNLPDLGQFVGRNASQALADAGLQTAINGGSLNDNLKQSLQGATATVLEASLFYNVGDLGIRSGLADSGAEKTALHALAGGLAAEATGSDFRTGAIAAGANEALVKHLDDWLGGQPSMHESLLVAASKVTGIVAAGVAGGDVQKGAEIAGNATNYNYLAEHQRAQRARDRETCKGMDCARVELKWQMIDSGQDGALAAGIVKGIADESLSTVTDVLSLFKGSTWDAISQLLQQDNVLAALGGAVVDSYRQQFDTIAQQYERAGLDGAFQAGVESGKLLTDIVSTLAPVGGVAKKGVNVVAIAGKAGKSERALTVTFVDADGKALLGASPAGNVVDGGVRSVRKTEPGSLDGSTVTNSAKARDSASNVALFERQRAGYAAQEIRSAQPVGSALKDDPYHRAPSYVIDQIPEKGRLFTIRGGDGKSFNLTQMEGAVDGKSGIFEWLVNSKGELTHQRFIPAGRITGTPNQVPSRLPR